MGSAQEDTLPYGRATAPLRRPPQGEAKPDGRISKSPHKVDNPTLRYYSKRAFNPSPGWWLTKNKQRSIEEK